MAASTMRLDSPKEESATDLTSHIVPDCSSPNARPPGPDDHHFAVVRRCGVVLGYPTMLVYAVLIPAPTPTGMQFDYQLGDGTQIASNLVAFNKDFGTRCQRQSAEQHLRDQIKKQAQLPTITQLATFTSENNLPTTFKHLLTTSPEPSKLARMLSYYRLSHQQHALRSITRKTRKPLHEERRVCMAARDQLQEHYGVRLSWKTVFDALVALEVSAARYRRCGSVKDLIWNTDEFVMHFPAYRRHILVERLSILPDPADFMTAYILDKSMEGGSMGRLLHPQASRVLKEDMFNRTPVLQRAFVG